MSASTHSCIKSVVAGLCASVALLASNGAAAQGAPTSRNADAATLVRRGQALLDAGQVDAACAKFEAAETLESGPLALLRLGDCYQRAARTASAFHTFLEAEALARGKKDFERAQFAAQRVAALEPRLTRVVFVVPMTSRVPGLTVRLGANTVPPSSWDKPIAVDPGVQQLSASSKGYTTWRLEIDASHGEGQQYQVVVPTLAPARGVRSELSRRNAYRTAGVVTGSVGLAGLGAGAVFRAMSHNANDAKSCPAGAVECTPSASSKSSLADAAAVSFAVGGALVATGVTLFVLAPSPDNQEQHALRVAARYANSGGRVQLEGVW
jgi:tetratricopeptide (TPR) repeat protein